MPERTYPGVIIEEVPAGLRPIEGVGTSTAGFIGEARRGLPATPHALSSFADFERLLGRAEPGERGLLARVEATLPGAVGLQCELTHDDRERLTRAGVNCLREAPDGGIVVWGARTLAADAEWRYVPVRRGTRWAVFEPNGPELWDGLRLAITTFLHGLFREGAFQGVTPEEAFFVRCDRSTNPQQSVDAGIVTAEVGFAPLRPGEFVVIRLQQRALVV